jgi:alpha-ketoglutarate-dependent 2,4-dichlorophenoxyacetate dioxygenase
MALMAKPLHPLFAAELSGIDIRLPLDLAQKAEIEAAFRRYGVAVFHHDRPLTDEEHLAFAGSFGPLQRQTIVATLGSKLRLKYPQLIDVGNIGPDGKVMREDDRRRAFNRGNLLWHSDASFDANRAVFSMLAAHTVPPEGADTEFADMRAAYEALTEARKAEIDGLIAEHSVWHSRALGGMPSTPEEQKTRPPARHKLVHVHPGSGRKALYLASHISHIVGWPAEKGRALLDELTAFATQPRFVYRHKWRLGDLVIWDNLCTMHRGTPFDDTRVPRDVRRATTLEREMATA